MLIRIEIWNRCLYMVFIFICFPNLTDGGRGCSRRQTNKEDSIFLSATSFPFKCTVLPNTSSPAAYVKNKLNRANFDTSVKVGTRILQPW